MNEEKAIQVKNLSKVYYTGRILDPDATLAEQAFRIMTGPFRRIWKLLQGQQTGAAELDEEFLALQDISFDVKRGEVVGIIGHNGAGKSTLLKILSRITYPSHGEVILEGRVGALLEVGTGFNPELTGRENVYLNGTILGMSNAEVTRKFNDIVDFAGVHKFIDTPVKHYSSGMGVRLAFAVAAHLEPEILVIDEVLSVGDAQFQQKSIGKMGEVAQSGRTVLFVSHNLAAVRELCDRAILLEHGRIVHDGNVEDVIDKYLGDASSDLGEVSWADGISNDDVDELDLLAVRVLDDKGHVANMIGFDQNYTIEIKYEIYKPLPRLRVGFRIETSSGVVVLAPYDVDNKQNHGERTPGRYISRCEMPGHLLSPGNYFISINIGIIHMKNLCRLDRVLSLTIASTRRKDPNENLERRPGLIVPNLQWDVQSSEIISEGG